MGFETSGGGETNSASFLQTCLEEKINEAVKIISNQGASINPFLYIEFKFSDEEGYTNITYLCYNQNQDEYCINQEPMLMKHIEGEIQGYISQEVNGCFEDLKISLEDQGYEIDSLNSHYNGFDVELIEKRIIVNIDGDLTLTKSEQTTMQEGFKIIFPSRLYETAFIAQEIVSQEARFCEFDELNYMMFNQNYKVSKTSTLNSTIIYKIEHRDSSNKFKFAIKEKCTPAD